MALRPTSSLRRRRRCRSTARGRAIALECVRVGDRTAAARRVPARRARLGRDVARLPGSASATRRLARTRLLAPRLRPLDAAAARRALGAGLHARPGARGAAGAASRALDIAAAHGCSATATAARSRSCYAARFPTRRRRDRASRRISSSRTSSIASIAAARDAYEQGDLRAAAGALPRRSGLRVLGLERRLARSGVPRLEHRGRDRHRSSAPCWRCRARTTNTARSRRSAAIRRRLPQTELLEIPQCGHSPHRDQPELLIREAGRFIRARTR